MLKASQFLFSEDEEDYKKEVEFEDLYLPET